MTTHKKNASPTSDVSVSTDQQDYAPGSTANITASGFAAGSTVTFHVQHVSDAGPDGIWGTPDDVIEITSGAGHDPWSVTDGGPGDLDGEVNGSITTSWYVNPDDSLGATFLLTAQSGDALATASFTDGPIVVATGATASLDETAGLQNATATPSPAGDANDNDIALASLPGVFTTRLTALGAGTATGAALSGYTGAAGNTGSNAFTLNPAPGAVITDVSFTDSLGAALNGLDSGLQTLDGTHILLYTDTNNNIVLGRAGSSSGTIVFAAYIEETGSPLSGGKIWTVEYQPLKHPDATNPDDAVNLLNKVFIGAAQDLTFSLANAPSGQNLFLMFTTANPTTFTDASNVVRISSPAIIATGKDPADQSGGANITTGDTINTSQAGGPTTFGTNNQMIVEQEGIRFTFVTGARQDMTIPNLDQTEADVESNIDFTGMFNARSASFDVVQLQSGKSAVVTINAFNTAKESGVDFVNGYAGDTTVNITNVRVINNSTGLVIENSDGTVNDPSIVITITSGVATITGVKAGYKIEYTTSADHNRVLVQNGAALNASGNNHAAFDIGGFKLLQVSNATAEIGSSMIFEDDGPSATGTPVTGTVDEDGLPNGIPGGVGDVAGEATVASGSVTGIFQSGADTPLTYSMSSDTSGLPTLSSGGTTLVYSVVGNTLTATAGVGGATVFTFSLTSAGAYTFTLVGPLDHPAGNNENDITLNLGTLLQASDKDGDTVTAAAEKLVITVDDDSPNATGTAVTGTVDEDGLANGIPGGVGDVAGEATVANGSVTGIFHSGADVPLTYSVSSDTSGLQALSSGGTALVYSVVGNTLTATAGAGGATVFTFSLTSAAAYTFTLLKPLDHPAGNNENDININLGTLLQATDKDGDTVTASAEKLVITVDDDTPTATGTPVTGTVDEDGLANGIAGGVGDVAGEATIASGSVTGIFQSGADVPLTYGLSSDTSALQALSSGGTALVYSVSGNTLTATAGAGGATVFTFSLTSAGAYTFTLLKPLDHPAGNNENDININLGTLLQATDKDSDTVTAAAEKLVITVNDDTPTATGTPVTGTVDEDGLANGIAGGVGDVAGEATVASGSVTGIFQSGADVPLTYGLSSDTSGLPALSSGGTALVYSVSGNTLTATAGAGGATVFTFSLTSAGAYTFTLLKPLDHPAGNNENDITLNLGSLLQATDKDSDTVTASAEKLVITVDDDTPTATGTPVTGTVDEDGLANGIAGGVGDVAGEATVASGSVTGIFQSGADVPLTYSMASDTSGLPALSSGGTALVYSVSGNTLTATAGAGGATVFTFSLTSAGAYTFTLLKPLDHPAGNNENDITINLGSLLQATDKDSDTVTASAEKLVITVDDDTPTATGTPVTGTVDEDGLANGIAGGVGDVAGEATVASGSVTGIFQSGADVPLTYGLSSDTSGLPALSSGGTALVYGVVGNTLTATAGAGGASVFTFSLTAAGAYTFTLLKPLDHPAGNNENDITINLGSLLQATDKDSDTVTAAAEKLVITVDDDTPTATGTPVTGTVDEDGLTGGIPGGIGDVAGEATVASGSVTGIFQSGADVPLTYGLSSDTSALQALSSGGTALVYSVLNNTLTAKAGVGGANVFTLSLTAAGAYTFTLLGPLDHATGNNENDITINLGTLLQATDKDGDTVTASAEKLVITVDDDTPTLAFGNLIGTGSTLPQTGYWDKAYGADGLGATGLDITLVNGQFTLVRPDNTTTTGTGTLTEQAPSPDVNGAYHFGGALTGDFDNNAATPNTSVDYTLTAYADGSYTLDLVQGFSSTVTFSSADGALGAGGPDPVQTLTIGTEHVVFFNAVATAPQTGANSILSGIGQGATDPTEAQLEALPANQKLFIGASNMNVSTSGIGVDNNILQGTTAGIGSGDESFVVNPETLLTSVKVFIDNSVSGYNPATEELYYTAYYDDGTTSGAPIKVLAADLHSEPKGQVSFTIQTATNKLIDAVQLIMGNGDVKIPTIQFIKQVENLASDVKLSFNATITDKDGDTATSAFNANLFASDGAAATFNYTLVGTSGARDAFNVDLARTENTYQVTGFDVTAGHHDAIVLIGDQASTFSINNAGANSIVTVNETGGQVTTITVVGVDLLNTDIVHGSA
ncbi:beta strand repeat-containing protein [Pseudomonas sp. NY15181]|uniref:beta strand repeat-containing protein n=1 Tax=Pseudomonas sp. NY15181 TaxID=3400349 RepID=UPI003A8872B7